ncbi:MAG: RNA-protein complex protein Nop10 [Methanosarcinaceae archaeon]|nr:RNA-protein complex protein Nop10 [Methanosarcinaceae archaeon]
MSRFRRCVQCGQYTLKDTCPDCGNRTRDPRPARYSPIDPYGKYRRISKRKGMLDERD